MSRKIPRPDPPWPFELAWVGLGSPREVEETRAGRSIRGLEQEGLTIGQGSSLRPRIRVDGSPRAGLRPPVH